MTTEVIAPEAAEAEFERICDQFRIDHKGSEDDRSFRESKGTVVAAIVAGTLAMDLEGKVVFRPSTPGVEPLKFREATGAVWMAMDASDGGVTRLALAAQALTKSAPGTMAKLLARDFLVVLALTKLFLAQG